MTQNDASLADGLPPPGAADLAHSQQLSVLIRTRMERACGSLTFAEFMQCCLYTPGLGYYSAGRTKLGAGGDFVTAPEASPLFARCLAVQIGDILGQLRDGEILEFGAGSGALAVALLRELDLRQSLPVRYRILEPSADLRARQQQVLAAEMPHMRDRVQWLDVLPADEFNGVLLANEVLDAMPCERFRKVDGGVRPLHVTWRDGGFRWQLGAPNAALSRAVAAVEVDLGGPLPDGYESEINLVVPAWVDTVARCLAQGVLLCVDYGYGRAELYHPQRDSGTLLCHYRHRAHSDPLILVGLQDISASVDFSAVAQAGTAAGLDLMGYSSQAWFLFAAGLAELVEATACEDLATRVTIAREVKMLTLPGEMGERFKAIALSRNIDEPLRGFALRDSRSRL